MDQMMDYIKKLRACARQFLQKEAGYILQKGQLMDQIEEQRKTQEEIGKFMISISSCAFLMWTRIPK
jgi:hypothetical protein